MSTAQEFALIALQLEWLDSYVRALPAGEDGARLHDALSALAVARALMNELTSIGTADAPLSSASAVEAV